MCLYFTVFFLLFTSSDGAVAGEVSKMSKFEVAIQLTQDFPPSKPTPHHNVVMSFNLILRSSRMSLKRINTPSTHDLYFAGSSASRLSDGESERHNRSNPSRKCVCICCLLVATCRHLLPGGIYYSSTDNHFDHVLETIIMVTWKFTRRLLDK